MNKKKARKLLGYNNQQLSELLGVNKYYLDRVKELSASHIKIIMGELDKRELKECLTRVDLLNSEISKNRIIINQIQRALNS